MEVLIKIMIHFLCICHVVQSAPRRPRLTIAESPSYFYSNIDGDSNAYSFGYDVSDPATGNTQFRTEERYPNGTVIGTYGYVDALGTLQRFRYIADQMGYRVMTDIPNKFQAPISPYTTENPTTVPVESSITWTRPKRPNKKNTASSPTNIMKKNPNRYINTNYPPSYYVQYH